MIRYYFILTLLLGNLVVSAQENRMLKRTDFQNQTYSNQWVYVKYNTGKTPNKAKNSSSAQRTSLQNLYKIQVPNGKDPIQFCNELRSNSDIEYADPILTYQLLSVPSDPLIGNQYYLDNIQAYDAWEVTTGDDDITIGIIDSGLDLDHEDLVNNLWLNNDDPIDGVDNDNNGYVDDYYGYDFADIDTDPSIQNGNHGMIVGGVASASANNGIGIAGVGYNTKVAALKGFRSSDGFSGGLYTAITYAAENGIQVLNLSWGRMGTPLQSEQDIISDAVLNHDVVVVAAAGNEGGKPTEEDKWYPASYDHVLSVGASDANDQKSSGSTFNYSVDLIAPGVSIYSTVNNNGYTTGGPGTSFATPQVAAAAALVKDVYPQLSAIQVMERVRATADDIYDVGTNSAYDGKLGKGRLNVYRAVSESGVKSLRVADPSFISNYGDVAFFGDTVQVNAMLTNYLAAVNNPTLTISSPDANAEISVGSFFPGYLSTEESKPIAFEIILDENLAPESDIDLRLDFQATGYHDFQFLSLTTSPDFAAFGNENVQMTISGNGNLGFDTYGPNWEGLGFRFLSDTLLTYTGLMIATSASSVSDNIIDQYLSYARDEDFDVAQYYKLSHHQGADYFGSSSFTDSQHPLLIEQSNLAWEGDDFLIVKYRLVNTSASAINDLHLGAFADWDLDDPTSNQATHDGVNEYLFVQNESSDQFAGIKVLGGDINRYSAIDVGDFNGNTSDFGTELNDASKYDFLVNQTLTTAGSVGSGNDVAVLHGTTVNQLDGYDEAIIYVIYGVADTKANLDIKIQEAENRITDFAQKPQVLETFFTCDGNIALDPSAGTQYAFYEDPLTNDLITMGTSFSPATLTKDTLFYVRNMDENYASDVYEIRVKLLSDIADFEMSTDTLYLDHPTTNVVQFTDQSLDATIWSWGFDQGIVSSLQNPALSFSDPGSYQISLYIENAEGCSDTIEKQLVVANRPAAPVLSDQIICANETVILNDPSADWLKLYRFTNESEPIMSGSNLEIENIEHDSIFYISGVYADFESDKVPVLIDVLEVDGDIIFLPDTTTTDHQILLQSTSISAGSSIEWFIDEISAGQEMSISIPAAGENISVRLEVTSSDDCVKSVEQQISISTSPFASHPDIVACGSEEVVIRPENGTYFGFYEDAALTQLIKKGTMLRTNTHDQVYVVGLDDGLPGMPIQVNIDQEDVTLDMASVTEAIGQQQQLDLFAVTSNAISNYRWYINGVLTETIANPTFFLNNELYEITLEVETENGCSASITQVFDFQIPLSNDEVSDWLIYPNPSEGLVFLRNPEEASAAQLIDLNGKEVFKTESPERVLDLTSLPRGVYLLKIQTISEELAFTLVLK